VILDTTSMYAESGGQEADSGRIRGDGFELEVLDVQKPVKGLVSHRVLVKSGELSVGSKAVTSVDYEWRLGACQAHSGTHIVHAALREVLGPSALQSGSYNKPGYLRLDFSWQQALSLETRSEIEEVTNLAIRGDLAVSSQFMSVAEAKTWGAVALFGETYDESVRVIQIGGPWSRELCGGTHVARSSQVGLVSLIGESSVGSGSRRVEALVGIEAFRALATERALVARLTDAFKAPREQVEERIYESVEELKAAQKKLASLQTSMLMEKIPQAISSAQKHGSSKLVNVELGAISDGSDLRSLALDAVSRVGSEAAVIVITAIADSKPVVAVATTDAARAAGLKAGDLVRTASQILGGGGGGKPDYAQGGGSDSSKLPAAILAIREALN
jgi:alanyl-tRNA synthetase